MSNNKIYVKLLLDKQQYSKGLFDAGKSLRTFSGTFGKMSRSVFGGLSMFSLATSAIDGMRQAAHAAVTANMEFEKSLSSLRALTGVTAGELDYFRTEAVRMGMDSSQSAVQMVDAFKLIGSQMPELLKNKAALTQTAEAAVVLAEASGLDVPTAAKALTGALNQMGQSSAHASEYINILAAASQQGSADIPYLNKAVENAGGAASSTGIKFNELVAAIEAVAPRITDAASAGTNLRNIFLTLESSADRNLRPSVVGLSAALANLAAKGLGAVELTKMFGKESVTAAIALLQERDAFEQFRTGIEGTSTAYDQARINNDNLAGSVAKLESAWQSFLVSLNGSNGILKNVTDNLRDVVNWATRALMTPEEKAKYDARPTVDAARETMDLHMQQGSSPQVAVRQTMAQLSRDTFPMAQFAGQYKQQMDFYRAQMYNEGFGGPSTQRYKQAKENYEAAMQEKQAYDIVNAALRQRCEELEREASLTSAAASASAQGKEAPGALPSAGNREAPGAPPPEGSLAELDRQIRAKQQELAEAATATGRAAAQRAIDELEARKIRLQAEVETINFQQGRTAPAPVQYAAPNLGALAGGVDMPGKLTPPDFKPATEQAEDYTASLQGVATAFSSLSGTLSGNSDSMAQWALSSVASIAQMIVSLNGLAIAQGTASSAAAPWPANIAAIAGIVATIASVFASLPKFAEGGVVGGSSYFGDKLLARVNSGEVILNRRQQASLLRLTEDDRAPSVNIGFDRVRGADIFLALSNYMKKTGKRLDGF